MSQLQSYLNNSHKMHCNSIEFFKCFVFLLYDNFTFVQYILQLKYISFSTIHVMLMRLERNEYSKGAVDSKLRTSTRIILTALLRFKTATTDKMRSLASYFYHHFCPCAVTVPRKKCLNTVSFT